MILAPLMTEEILKNRDYTFILARHPGSWNQGHPYYVAWQDAQSAIWELAHSCHSFDQDGIQVYLAIRPFKKFACSDINQFNRVFQKQPLPEPVDLIDSLHDAIDDYFKCQESGPHQGRTIIILIDQLFEQDPDERILLVEELVKTSHSLDKLGQCNLIPELKILFLQVGNDPVINEFLSFIDDNLTKIGGKCDIVDFKSCLDIHGCIKSFLLKSLCD